MKLPWKTVQTHARNWGKEAAFALVCLVVLVTLALPRLQRPIEINQQKATGLSSWEPGHVWPQERISEFLSRDRLASRNAELISAGLASSAERVDVAADAIAPAPEPADRKLVRTDTLDLIVKRPADAAEQIRELTTRLGGYLETSEVSGDAGDQTASLTIRVPADKFEEARAEIHKLGLRVESEKVEAQDVTRQYVDQDAHLRNLRAEEQQYLAILKRATTVKDTLEVSEKLGEVRGQIEQQQAEFNALTKQVETVAISITLQAQVDTQVLGLNWRPLYRLKVAARDGLQGFGDYVAAVTALVFYLPAILLWIATILLGLAVAWRLLRWSSRVIFKRSQPSVEKEAR